MQNSFIDFTCGAISGISQVLVGHPLEYYKNVNSSTVKIRLQMESRTDQTILNRVITIFKREGIKSFFKGMTSPMTAYVPANAVTMSVYEGSLKNIQSLQIPLALKWFIAGGVAGVAYALVVCPFEMAKCVIQMQYEYLPKEFRSPIHVIMNFIKKEGILSIYKGLQITIVRDIPQNAVYFLSYEWARQTIQFYRGKLNLIEAIICGAFAGFTCCIASYPFDVIKTKLQCEITTPEKQRNYKSKFYDGGILGCYKSIMKQNGCSGFWIGFRSCSIYYMTGCAAQFSVYHFSQEFCKQFRLY
ncbi:hypothetical protein pb186bvf_009302 [Paramecium bursaria]